MFITNIVRWLPYVVKRSNPHKATKVANLGVLLVSVKGKNIQQGRNNSELE